MKHHTRSYLRALAALTLLAPSVYTVNAASLYWDTNGSTAGSGSVNGTWNTTNTLWTTDSTGASTTVAATTLNSDDLFFSAGTNATTGTVTVNGTQSAHSLNINDPVAFNLNSGTAINLGNATAGSGIFVTTSGVKSISTALILNSAATALNFSNSGGNTVFMYSTVTGAASAGTQTLTLGASGAAGWNLSGVIGDGVNGGKVALTVNSTGSGITFLTGANTYTGATTVNAGTLNLGNGGATGSLASSSALNTGGGTFAYTRTGTNTQAFTTTNLTAGASAITTSLATQTVNLGALNRSVGATVDFTTTGTITSSSGITSNPSGNSILGGWATVGGTTWAVANGAGNAITGLGSFTNDTWASGNNTDVTVSSSPTSGSTTNSLRFISTAAPLTLTLTGANTLTTGGILNNTSVSNTITGGSLTSASNELIVNTTGGTLNIGSVIANNGLNPLTVTKSGTGRLTVTTNNTYTGPTFINSGILQSNSSTGLGSGSAVTVASKGTLQVNNGLGLSVGSIAGGGAITFGSLGSLTTGQSSNSDTTTYSGVMSGTGAFIKGGLGTQTLSGANTYSGATTVSAGTLQLGNANALGFGGFHATAAGTSVTTGATLDLNGQTNVSEAITLNGTGVGGNGALINNSATAASIGDGIAAVTIAATGIGSGFSSAPGVTISGNATATASLGVTNASFTVSGGDKVYSVAPSVTISGSNGLSASGTAVLTAGKVTGINITTAGIGFTTAPTVTLGTGTVTSGTVNATITGNATNFTVGGLALTTAGSGYTGAPTFTVGGISQTVTPTFSSVILGSNSSIGGSGDIAIKGVVSGGFGLTKVGAGTLTLAGTNTYTGATNVTGGTLRINGDQTSANGAVSVTSGVTLGGFGRVGGATTIQSGGFLTAGDSTSAGTLAFAGDLTGTTGATFSLRIDSSHPLGFNYDMLAVTGNINLGNAKLLVTDLGTAQLTSGEQFTLLYGNSVTGTFLNLAEGASLKVLNSTYTISYANAAVVLTASAIPEPAAYAALAGLGILGFAAYRRRRAS